MAKIRGQAQKTKELVRDAREILTQFNGRMSIRQLYYALIGSGAMDPLEEKGYARLGKLITASQWSGEIPFDLVEDRTRPLRAAASWSNAEDFITDAIRQFRLNIWELQRAYTIVLLEKDALAGIFEPITREYGVTLLVGKGQVSTSAIRAVALDVVAKNKPVVNVLMFGDHDASGINIMESFDERLRRMLTLLNSDTAVNARREGILFTDIAKFNLPTNPTKEKDNLGPSFLAEFGPNASVELDALPIEELERRIHLSIVGSLDMDAYTATRDEETRIRRQMSS